MAGRRRRAAAQLAQQVLALGAVLRTLERPQQGIAGFHMPPELQQQITTRGMVGSVVRQPRVVICC